jgi:hypothetical protein
MSAHVAEIAPGDGEVLPPPVFAPNGARGCGHGWSAGRHQAGGAERVERVVQGSRPGGAEEAGVAKPKEKLGKRFGLCVFFAPPGREGKSTSLPRVPRRAASPRLCRTRALPDSWSSATCSVCGNMLPRFAWKHGTISTGNLPTGRHSPAPLGPKKAGGMSPT